MRAPVLLISIGIGAVVVAAACGGGGGGGGGGTVGPSPAPGGGAAATVTLTNNGVSIQSVRIEIGQAVRFINNGSRMVEVTSDPHPTHELCPPINDSVGPIAPGQTKDVTFTVRGTCSYHDHINPDDGRFRGTILVGVSEPGPAPDYRTSS